VPPEAMTAVEVKDVDNSSVIIGGVMTANFPQEARNFRRSAAAATSASFSGLAMGLSFGLTAKTDKRPHPRNNIKPKLNDGQITFAFN
jgi:hypothetical protein